MKKGNKECFIVKKEELIDKLGQIHSKGNVVITMGAGDLWMKGNEIIGYLDR